MPFQHVVGLLRRQLLGATGVTHCVRHFSKYFSRAQTKRQPLNTKWAKKGYVKGKGCRSTGWHTSKGKYIIDKRKVVELVVPDLTNFRLKPYVATTVRALQYPLAKNLLDKSHPNGASGP